MNDFLLSQIKKKIKYEKFIELEEFLEILLYDKKFGFYKTLDNNQSQLIGSEGHFVTSPEISQVFGELIGIWIFNVCEKHNFESINLLELGPGKGSLMSDILRTLKNYKNKIHLNVHLVEISESLKSFQKKSLKQFNLPIYWHNDIFNIKNNINGKPIVIISNEFFDCFPIRQYKYNICNNKFSKIVIKLKEKSFYFSDVKINEEDISLINSIIDKNINSLDDQIIIEYSPMISVYINEICELIKENNGICLNIDYGKNDPYGSTIQSIHKNKKSSFFENIDDSDYSSLVDFNNIRKIVEGNGLFCFPLQTQRNFFLKMGINHRVESLSKNATSTQKHRLINSYERLISRRYMGDLFKVNCFSLNKFNALGF